MEYAFGGQCTYKGQLRGALVHGAGKQVVESGYVVEGDLLEPDGELALVRLAQSEEIFLRGISGDLL